jgi:enoyl-CoA hydratase/carnithine racemase
VVGAINGWALGGGFEWAMKSVLNRTAACDLRQALQLETEATVAGFMDPETTARLKDF